MLVLKLLDRRNSANCPNKEVWFSEIEPKIRVVHQGSKMQCHLSKPRCDLPGYHRAFKSNGPATPATTISAGPTGLLLVAARTSLLPPCLLPGAAMRDERQRGEHEAKESGNEAKGDWDNKENLEI